MVATCPMEPLAIPAKTTAQKMIDAAICAYSIVGKEYQPIFFFNEPVRWVDGPQVISGGEERIDAGLIGETDDGWVVLSLRGTLSTFDGIQSFLAFFEDWRQDDETLQVPFDPPGSGGFGKVHQGFLDAVMALWPCIEKYLIARDWSKLEGLRITGHSKGAAMSFLCAVLVHYSKSSLPKGGPKQIEVHAFAAPLAGDSVFAQRYDDIHLEEHTFRYQRESDLVPFLPAYTTFDVLHKWPFELEHPKIDAVRLILEFTHRGYKLVGALEFYPDHTAVLQWPAPLGGDTGQDAAQTAILRVIHAGAVGQIADAHSAINSYWPSIFAHEMPALPAQKLAEAVHAAQVAHMRALAAGD